MTERPRQKVVVADVDLTPDAISTEVTLRENGIDSCTMIANNDQGKQYLGNMVMGDTVTVKYAYEEDNPDWDNLKPVFRGTIQELYPSMDKTGEIVKVVAYGQGFWMLNMNVVASYGTQAGGSTITTPQSIIRDIIANYVNKILGLGTSSYWPSINTDYVYQPQKHLGGNIELPYLAFPYTKSMMALQEVIKLALSGIYTDAMANSYPDWVGLHWIIDVDANLLVAPIGNHEVYAYTGYPPAPHYIAEKWPTRPLLSPLVVRQDMITQQFKQAIFNANYIIAAGKFICPLNEAWTEGHASDWVGYKKVPPNWVADQNLVFATDDDGSGDTPLLSLPNNTRSLKLEINNAVFEGCILHRLIYEDGGIIDLTALSSRNNPPRIGFWAAKGGGVASGSLQARFCKSKLVNGIEVPDLDNCFSAKISIGAADNNWVWAEFLIGPMSTGWTIIGALDWTKVRWVGIRWTQETIPLSPSNVWLDYLEISASVLRFAKDSVHIGQRGCKIMMIKDTLAKTNTLKASDINNPLAQLCIYELSRQRVDIITGSIVIPINPTLMAGQIVSLITDFEPYIVDYRINQVLHTFSRVGALTELSLTDDVYNSVSMANQADLYGQITKALDPNNYLNKTWASMFAAGDISIDMELIGADFPMPMLTIGYAQNGYTDPAYGKYRKILNNSVQITALPNSGFVLNYWIKDGQDAGSSNPITFTMDKSHTITPLFKVQGP